MNAKHLQLCASPEWAEVVEKYVIPWAVGDGRLGDDLLEVGPGPGSTTNVLKTMATRLTAIEVDAGLARSLGARLSGSNVTVLHADATRLPLADGSFSSAVSFTMLHHVPTTAFQDRLFAEVARVLRPGALLVGVDSLDGPEF